MPIEGPLNLEDIEKIDLVEASSLDKHYLRLMAHCLASFKLMYQETPRKGFPSEDVRLEWCMNQDVLKNQPEFIPVLMKQFASAESYLENVAASYRVLPLELTLDHLISYSLNPSL
ncbi:hypothetical protein EV05_0988 [Prochlorococcus sp. MIT 0601]|nr:hypothetical protein EV05_0988 [Prochlorococcus sp. MIT 0601]